MKHTMIVEGKCSKTPHKLMFCVAVCENKSADMFAKRSED